MRKREGVFLTEGRRSVDQINSLSPESILEVLTTGEKYYGKERVLDKRQLESVSPVKTPQYVTGVVKLPAGAYSGKLPDNPGNRVLFLNAIQDPGNTGTLIRSAALFGFSGVVSSEGGSDPFSPKSVQASAGTLFSVWIRRGRGAEPIEELKNRGYTVITADMNGDTDLLRPGAELPERLVLVVGNEGRGVSQEIRELSDYILSVPFDASAGESLNAAVAGSICMSSFFSGTGSSGDYEYT
ncbi:MAG: TrmH family RNA methyltransferase [Chitinivibrionales bacterium]